MKQHTKQKTEARTEAKLKLMEAKYEEMIKERQN